MINVDVIVPTFKRGPLLQEALQSVKNQTYPHWTCWVVEDGQSDETKREIAAFLEDARFRYLPGQHLGTPSGPRNRGIRMGEGEYVAFLDDDDIWLPEKLGRQLACFRENPENVLVGANAFRWDPSRPFSAKTTPKYFRKSRYWHKPVPYPAMLRSNRFITSSIMIKREVLKLSGLFNENLQMAEDYELWLRIGAVGQMWNLSEPLLIYRLSQPTFYKPLDKKEDYLYKAKILDLLTGDRDGLPSPLRLPENIQKLKDCRSEIDYLKKGHRSLGRIRHFLERQFFGKGGY